MRHSGVYLFTVFVQIYMILAFKPLKQTNFGIKVNKRDVLMSIVNKPQVNIYDTPDVVGTEMCNYFINAAKKEISAKGAFYVAIPGGSAVKLLKFLKDKKNEIDWSKVYLFYVNHKCVPDNDDSATHFKARNIFLDAVGNVKTYVPDDTKLDAKDRAAAYESTLKSVVPQKNGLPCFDLVVLGFGKDGHIGSLYPGRNEVTNKSALVLSVDKVGFRNYINRIYSFNSNYY